MRQKILGIVGRLRKASCNHATLKATQELLPASIVLDLVELHGSPVFNQDQEMAPAAAVPEFKRRILAADAILFATPEYNYSAPGKAAAKAELLPVSSSVGRHIPLTPSQQRTTTAIFEALSDQGCARSQSVDRVSLDTRATCTKVQAASGTVLCDSANRHRN